MLETKMKTSAITWLSITTIFLLTVTIFSVMNILFSWVFYITIIGQAFLLYSVYKILTDSYTTDKTFEDFYEDHPIKKEE